MTKNRYVLYGMQISTDLVFEQLVQAGKKEEALPCITIEESAIPEWILQEEKKKYEFGQELSWLSNKTMWMVVKDGKHIGYRLKEGGNTGYAKTYLLGYGMAMLALQRGMPAIHCSAVAGEKGAVLIAGESGAGKSTVTCGLLERGYRLLADDMAVVQTFSGKKDSRELTLVYPAFPYQKLCRDAAVRRGYALEKLLYINEEKDKFLVPWKGDFLTEPEPVQAFFMLGVSEKKKVTLRQIQGLACLGLYGENLFLRHLLKQEKYRPDIGQKCLELAAQVPSFYLERPKEGDSTEEVLEQILNTIK